MMIAADRRHHEDRVRFFSVQRSMRDIGDREVLDHIAALQFEIADPIELMWRLIRSVRQCDARHQRHETSECSEQSRYMSSLRSSECDGYSFKNFEISPKNRLRCF